MIWLYFFTSDTSSALKEIQSVPSSFFRQGHLFSVPVWNGQRQYGGLNQLVVSTEAPTSVTK
jgi:hypothetical protein